MLALLTQVWILFLLFVSPDCIMLLYESYLHTLETLVAGPRPIANFQSHLTVQIECSTSTNLSRPKNLVNNFKCSKLRRLLATAVQSQITSFRKPRWLPASPLRFQTLTAGPRLAKRFCCVLSNC